jgi:hypothetical protein
MSESGPLLERAEGEVQQAQAILDRIGQVLQTVDAARSVPGGRVLIRAGVFMIAGGIALVGLAVVRSRLRP